MSTSCAHGLTRILASSCFQSAVVNDSSCQSRVQGLNPGHGREARDSPVPIFKRERGSEKGYGYMPPKGPQTMVETILLWSVRL